MIQKQFLGGAVEYTDFIFAEWKDFPNECPGYGTETSQNSPLGL